MDRKNHPPKYPHPNSMCASSSSKCRRSQLQSFTLYPRDITTEASILFGTQFIFLIRNCPVAQPNIKLLRSNSPLLFIAPRPLLLPLKVAMTQPPIIGCPLPSLLEPLSELFLAHDFKYHPHNWCFLNMYLQSHPLPLLSRPLCLTASSMPPPVVVQPLSRVRLFGTPWSAAPQASLSFTNSRSLLKLLSIESMMPSNHLNFCHPLFFLTSIFPSIRVFSNESALHIRQPKYWSFSFIISPFNEYSGLISFRIGCLDLFAAQWTLKSLLQHHSSKASIL